MAHIHSVFDSNEHFAIDPVTRAIANSLAKKIVVMQFDHNSERFTFKIPKVDGHNMVNCDRVEIHYINVDAVDKTLKSTGVYEVNDIQPSPDDNSVAVFSWLISRNCTKYAGTLSFLIHFACTTDGVEDYAWNTAIFQSITIGNGMNNGAEVLEPFPDILAQWQAQLFSASETAVLNVTTAEANALAAIEAAGEAKKQAVLDSIPDEYEALSALADSNYRNKAGAIVLDAEGESIALNDASEYPLQNLKVFGKSTQDGTPTPDAPVDIVSVESPVVSVCSKNIWDEETEMGYWQSVNGEAYTSDNQIRSKNFIPIIPKATIYVTAPNDKTIDFVFYDRNKSYLSSRSIAQEVTSPDEAYYMHINLRSDYGTTYNNDVCISLIPLNSEYEQGNEAQTVETSYTLPGIPVSSGGNYTDANGQAWICDEVDLARGVYVQRIGTKVYDGSDDEYWLFTNTGPLLYHIAISNKRSNYEQVPNALLCSHFTVPPSMNSYKNGCITETYYHNGNVNILINYNDGVGGLDAFIEFLQANPITVKYVLKTPIETPLSEAEISAFKALHSNRPNTTILNDAGAHMAVSYVADTKTYIDKKIAEMMKGVTE